MSRRTLNLKGLNGGVNVRLRVINIVHFSVGSIFRLKSKRMIDLGMKTFDLVPQVGYVKPLKSLGI